MIRGWVGEAGRWCFGDNWCDREWVCSGLLAVWQLAADKTFEVDRSLLASPRFIRKQLSAIQRARNVKRDQLVVYSQSSQVYVFVGVLTGQVLS